MRYKSKMKLTYLPYLLKFKHPFGVSSNTRKETPSIFLKIENAGKIGYGEACLPAYLGESVDDTIRFFEKAKILLRRFKLERGIEKLVVEVDMISNGNNAAKAAIDLALNDLIAKLHGKTYCELLGIPKCSPVATSFTIGIDSEDKIEQKLIEASEFSILKIKAGTKDDKALINLIRKYTNKPLYVDVNQGWTDKNYVLDMIFWLKEKNVVLIEQPMPVHLKEEMAWVTERSPIPTIADESVKRLQDLEGLNKSFTGINIKLMKCTGLIEAKKMIDFAKNNHLKILLGCMAESSCGTSAMAQLMSFADYIDLDAPNLYSNDPFEGITYLDGKIHLNEFPGFGCKPVKEKIEF